MDELTSVCLHASEGDFFEYLKLWVEKDKVTLAMSNIAEESKPKCDCGAPGLRSHLCPYQDDVNEVEKMCNCCTRCTADCSDDI
jgi:hypothetical protein